MKKKEEPSIVEDTPEEETDRELMGKALFRAEETFKKYLSDQGVDSAYFTIRFTAWALSVGGFKPLFKIEIDDRSEADGEYVK